MRKAAVITGGGRGIGASIAHKLAKDGYAVTISYESDRLSAENVIENIQKNGGEAACIRADVSIESDILNLFEYSKRNYGSLSLLVNNCGITGGFSRLDSLRSEVLERVFRVNVLGSFLCAREAVKTMSIKQGGNGGSIINISSRAAELGGSGEWIHYASSKGAIDSLTRGLAKEVALDGIRVNAVAPGLIETQLHASAGRPNRAAELASTIPLCRPGLPDDVAECVSWLVSPSASYITGAIVPVSGGR
jgi:NAD(P)-dependent dehydrogenase (short-subunit alcohol dehydrogenase family)